MAENSKIAWTHHTFNPWMGCVKVSAGCANCYAEKLVTGRMGLDVWGVDASRKVTSVQNWKKPYKWDRDAALAGERHRVFCASLCDVFEDHRVAHEYRPRLFDLMRETPNLDWLLLTKRPERISSCLPDSWFPGWPNVWLGTSIEDNSVVERAVHLRKVATIVRFVSYEPAIGPIDQLNLEGINWLICGGESGPRFREMKLTWAREIRDRCRQLNVPFFFKQVSAFRPGQGDLDGKLIREYPTMTRENHKETMFRKPEVTR